MAFALSQAQAPKLPTHFFQAFVSALLPLFTPAINFSFYRF
jgi:hypothetical protein